MEDDGHTKAVSKDSNVTHEPGYLAKSFHGLVSSVRDSCLLSPATERLTDLVSMSEVAILPTDMTNMAMA